MGVAILIKPSLGPSASPLPIHWPTTFGRIVSVRLGERGSGEQTRWFPQIEYQYSVQGRTMVSTRLTQGPELSWRTRSEANHFLDRYIARSSVLVYYNPDNISEAVLEPDGGGLEPALWLGIALVLSGLGVLITYDRIG